MDTVNLREANTNLSRLVDRAAAGEEFLITKGGRPLAKLVPLAQRSERRPLGLLRGRVRVSDNFDAPLPEDSSPDAAMRTYKVPLLPAT